MTGEGALYRSYLEAVRDGIFREVEGLPEEALNGDLGIPETNTLYVSAYHAGSATRYWVAVFIGGGSVERDRAREFQARGTVGDLVALWDDTLRRSGDVLDGLKASDFDAPRRFIMGSAEREGTVRDGLLHVIEHANIHLGHIQLARQLWEYRRDPAV